LHFNQVCKVRPLKRGLPQLKSYQMQQFKVQPHFRKVRHKHKLLARNQI
jgi:hypothetical protein